MARIYLDTNLWNLSCDQRLDAKMLLRRLDEQGATLVLSLHAVDELSRTFLAPNARERAKTLFVHLSEYTNSGLRCLTKEISELLKAEMWALHGVSNSQKFLQGEDVRKIEKLIDSYGQGHPPDGCLDGLPAQIRLSQRERKRLVASMKARPHLAAELIGVSEDDYSAWTEHQLQSATSVRLMGEKLRALFPDEDRAELAEWANALVKNRSRVAIAMLRADFYYNWRCARRGSNPKDLLDDLSHMINAAYCDVYATAETKQAEYARLILDTTRVAFYDRTSCRLDEWLIAIAARESH